MTRSRDVADTQDNSGGAVAPFIAGKNKIINGDFGIWQRGTSFTHAPGFAYTADRWLVGGFSTITRQAFTPGTAPVAGYEGQFFARWDITSNSQNYEFVQRIENARTFAGQTTTVSFWAKLNSGSTAFGANGAQNFGTGGSPSSQVQLSLGAFTPTASWQRFTFVVSVPSVSGKTFGTNNDSFLFFSIQAQNSATGALDIWGVQWETGSVATPFTTATGTIQGELAACQRYFANLQPSTADYGTVISMFQATSGSTAKGGIQFPVPMRASASITLASATNFTLANASYTPIGGSSFTYAVGNTVNCRIDMSVASGLTAGNATALSGNTSNLLIQASAEL